MRVTQSMLSNNMIRNLSSSYNKMGKLQEQLTSGKKVNRPSDNPVTVMKGMGYRMQVDKVEQFKRNLGEVHNWVDNTDDALNEVGSVLHRAYELAVSGSTDTMTPEDREKLQSELAQMQEQLRDIANTKVGDKYIFSGTKTSTPLFDLETKEFNDPNAPGFEGLNKTTDVEVFDGVKLQVNTPGHELFSGIDAVFNDLLEAVATGEELDGERFDKAIGEIQGQMDIVLTKRAEVGALSNRAEMIDDRLGSLEISATRQMSENEDVDYERVITDMLTEEAVHRAALSVGARIIQPSLVDFLR